MGISYIKGYKPRFNFQKLLLTKKVQQYLLQHPFLDSVFIDFADESVSTLQDIDFNKWVYPTPVIQDEDLKEIKTLKRAVKVNYLKREEQNSALGLKGEEQALLYERFLLINAGNEALVDKIEWLSRDQGDGLGFDILSKNLNGTDKYIEVKTTKLGREAPFFFTANEYNFSLEQEKNYHLYRIFDFNHHPKIFTCVGNYNQFCKISPTHYSGAFV